MLNKVILQGNIGRAPWVGLTKYGRDIATFSLATNTSWKDEAGEWQTHTDWHQITVFRKTTIQWIKDILKRGDTVYVEGKLTYHYWRDKYNNNAHFTPYVVIAGSEGKIEHIRSSQSTSCPQPISHVPAFPEEEGIYLSQKIENQEERSSEKNPLSGNALRGTPHKGNLLGRDFPRQTSTREPLSTHPQHFQKEKI
ncbi:MAG: hypothetical protein BGO67_10550 [Alphaproteobacteria bacterium 41-28]|nr:MAG: hypothetical protein BGO67_10550 [Alphaproteobacteria bacterium 41-28]